MSGAVKGKSSPPAGQIARIEMRGQMRIVPRIPIGIIDAVQDAGDAPDPRPQCRLHAHPKRAVADLACVGGTHRGHGVGEFYARFQGVDLPLPQIVLIEQRVRSAHT
jgi:hypothetical protein